MSARYGSAARSKSGAACGRMCCCRFTTTGESCTLERYKQVQLTERRKYQCGRGRGNARGVLRQTLRATIERSFPMPAQPASVRHRERKERRAAAAAAKAEAAAAALMATHSVANSTNARGCRRRRSAAPANGRMYIERNTDSDVGLSTDSEDAALHLR